MTEAYLTRKSDPVLLARLMQAPRRQLTPEEYFEQCVSFVFSTMSDESGVSKDWVRQGLKEDMIGLYRMAD